MCVDEKSQIQALDRSQPILPMRPGQPVEGATITKGTAPHRCSPPSMLRPDGASANATDTAEFPKFLDEIEAAVRGERSRQTAIGVR
ncbi:IS630 family transposase [Bradyrhizobium japonicum]|uniref:IS630 family transposase n=1 Tax=Bradyrhizobium japonicum TaxID=375 RepID=A0A1L3FNP6_BRAJP|nr:IS630 family transposase [Bradyrhizobium japonicum]